MTKATRKELDDLKERISRLESRLSWLDCVGGYYDRIRDLEQKVDLLAKDQDLGFDKVGPQPEKIVLLTREEAEKRAKEKIQNLANFQQQQALNQVFGCSITRGY